jgi:ABC-2 type transport system permease protein
VNHIWTLAKKELRGYFGSAVAIIFLGAFLAFTLFTFFWVEKFFARGVADLRPMFDWLPLLLIFLVAALAMRLWAEERKAGTIEVLLTLPVPRTRLVLGKFLAGMLLIALALALTFGLPLTISTMGDLDWGPVVGGYLAALLLAAAYLSIGMCVSAATDNQIVALIATFGVCALTYLPGSSWVADLVGSGAGDLLRRLGMGSRFASVARGVLDLRDLVYYGSVVVVFLGLNVVLLGMRGWSWGPRAALRRRNAAGAVALAAANAVLLNLWLTPVGRARIDLTEHGEYSLSAATRKIVAGLDEPLLIRGYFSAKTHPKLAPLVPRIRDLLDEYRVVGGGKLRVEFVDPGDDEAAQREAKERFDIEPMPLRFASRVEKSVINAYFSIAISYGDQHKVIGLDELIEVRTLDVGDIEIVPGNLEYAVTRAIKKVAADFQSIDALFSALPAAAELTAYVTPKTLPEHWKDGPARLKKVTDELAAKAGGKFVLHTVESSGDAQMRELFQTYGLRPYAELGSDAVYYFHLRLTVGGRPVRIVPPEELTEAGLKRAITEGLKRAAPGFSRTVGLWTPPAPPAAPEMQGMPPQQQQPPQRFEELRAALAANYEVRDVELGQRLGDDVDVLVLAGPSQLDAKAAEAIDQFVMRGGALVALAGSYRLAPSPRGLAIEKVQTGLESVFAAWGVRLGSDLVLDEHNDSFPVPVTRDLGNGMQIREMREAPYPFFVKVDGDAVAKGTVITSGIPGAVVHWGTSVGADAKLGEDVRKIDQLLRSSSASWMSASTDVQPDYSRYPESGFAKPTDLATDKRGAQVLAVAISGGFASAFGKAPAVGAGSGSAAGSGSGSAAGPNATPKTAGGELLSHSPPDARVVVFGSSAFVSDDLLGLAKQLGSDLALSNLELVHNAVDWALLDTDLASIRTRSTASRALTVAEDKRSGWEYGNYAIALLGLGVVAAAAWWRRRNVTPLTTSAT